MNVCMNDAMTAISDSALTVKLPPDLEGILSSGYISRDHCFFLKSLFETSGNATLEMFPDQIGFECFVNHFHFAGESQRGLAAIAAEFCRRASTEWRQLGFPGRLRFIASIKDNECTLRFHLVRDGLQWLADDLNLYRDEAIFTWDT